MTMPFKPQLLLFLALLLYCHLIGATNTLPPLYYPLTRRSGSFPAPDTANLTYLLQELESITSRFNATILSFASNSPVRKPKHLHGTQGSTVLLGDVGLEGNWFANLHIGEPAQMVDMDIDMLAADWWVLSTRSGRGSFFLDFNSRTYQDSKHSLSFPTFREPKDILHLPTIDRSIPISFAHCRPLKSWIRTLGPSGAHLGLAPGLSLSQTKTKPLLIQLLENGVIDRSIFSLKVMSGKDGVLSVGGASGTREKKVGQESVERSGVNKEMGRSDGSDTDKQRNAKEEKKMKNEDMMPKDGSTKGKGAKEEQLKHQETRRDGNLGNRVVVSANHPKENDLANEWKWSKVQGAEGWWEMLMTGVWVEGAKILQNQPIILDINIPFLLAPPPAARTFYASISGSRRLQPPYDQFHAYPCFTPPNIDFEFGEGWKVQVLKGKRDKGTFSPGGKFSLGRVTIGSEYCVGIVVESRMGTPDGENENGLEDTWVIGEPFFRDCQVAFDWEEKKIGIQRL